MQRLARAALIALALLGSAAGVRLSLSHLSTGEICPMLGPIPACNIVALGYIAVAISTIFSKSPWSKSLFFAGWSPVAALAFMGVALEIMGQDICPPGGLGVPQCVYSFLMAMMCLGLFLLYRRQRKPINFSEEA